MSPEFFGVAVAIVLGLFNLGWQGYTWITERRRGRSAFLAANLEVEPLRLVISNQGPATAASVSVKFDDSNESAIAIRRSQITDEFDLDPGSSLTFFADQPAVSMEHSLKLRLHWTDVRGRNERPVTLRIPTDEHRLHW